ncbi:hypothetical protein KKP89_02310, partial [Methanothermococcus sp. SCGC AD-155-N22]|nr:hypothetical protein [Methanothermococcus sp. SCGC AD-155-N22]
GDDLFIRLGWVVPVYGWLYELFYCVYLLFVFLYEYLDFYISGLLAYIGLEGLYLRKPYI